MKLLLMTLVLASCGAYERRDCYYSGDNCIPPTPTPAPLPTGIPGPKGDSGDRGPAGERGPAGSDGSSCTVASGPDGALVTCGANSVLILNGTDGAPGKDAEPTAYSVVGLVDPCGDAPGVYDEVFLRLANGLLVASFSDNSAGKNTRFSVLSPGNYVTTDGSSCFFSVDSNNQVYNEHY